MNEKLVLGILIAVMTFACATGFIFKKTQKTPATKNPTSSNWSWNNDWNKSTSGKITDKATPSQPQLTAPSYAEAIKMSGKEGKPVLVFFTASWCTWCQKMKNDSLVNAKVVELMKNYIFVTVDVDKEKDVVRKYKVGGVPFFLITNHQEDTLKTANKYLSASDFAAWLQNPSLYVQPKAETKPVVPSPPNKEPEKKKHERRHRFRRSPDNNPYGPPQQKPRNS